MEIKYENWKGKRYVVAREEGKIIQRRALKGSGFQNKTDALRIFKKNNTFYEDRQRTKLRNVTENTYLKKVKFNYQNPTPWLTKPIKKPRGKALYQVQGMFRGKMVYGRSHRKGSVIGLAETSAKAKQEAWDNFLRIIGEIETGNYDADEGITVVENNQVTNISEGWVFYN